MNNKFSLAFFSRAVCFIAILSLVFSSCSKEKEPVVVSVTSVSFDISNATMEVSEEQQLTATISPSNAINKTITWTSSNPTVATVSATGLVKAVAQGSATITATCGSKSAVCNVTIIEYADLSMYDVHGNKLSARSTANCYVVKKAGLYKIPMVYGNAIKNGTANTNAYDASASIYENHLKQHIDHKGVAINTGNAQKDPWVSQKYEIQKAGIVWQDSKNLVTGIEISGTAGVKEEKYVKFKVEEGNFTQGNAVVAIYDKDNEVAWSYHIWVTDVNLKSVSVKGRDDGKVYKMMPVNLGWCAPSSANSKNGGKYGNSLYYQFGRKDPFVADNGEYVGKAKTFYGPDGKENTGFSTEDLGKNDVVASIKNPGVYNKNQERVAYTNLWQYASRKSVYDPSPVGYKVAPRAAFSGFLKSGLLTYDKAEINRKGDFEGGYNFYTTGWQTGELIFLPITEWRYFDTGELASGSKYSSFLTNETASFTNCAPRTVSFGVSIANLSTGRQSIGMAIRAIEED
ncbi:MAG: Ig-like domain-containing protein [Bacteroidales bacterium]|nr:Ig-like domain-containing protein [Bacteroidales bacterium]